MSGKRALKHRAVCSQWSEYTAYKEFEQKAAGRSTEEQQTINVKMMEIFAEFGRIRQQSPKSKEAIGLAKKLQDLPAKQFRLIVGNKSIESERVCTADALLL